MKRTIAFLLVLVFLLTLCPFALAATSDSATTRPDPGQPSSNPEPTPHNHSWSPWYITKEPTCIEEGHRYCECYGCGQQYHESIPKIPHPFGEWHIVKEPTPEEPGAEQRVCSYCGLIEDRPLYVDGVPSPNPNPDPSPNPDPKPDPSPDPGTDHDPGPNLMLTKTVVSSPMDPRGYQLNEQIDYFISLENMSGRPLENIRLYDDKSGAPLATGQSMDGYGTLSGIFTYTVMPEDIDAGEVVNTATARWYYADTGESDALSSLPVTLPTLDLRESGIQLVKTRLNNPANGSFYIPGEVIHYEIRVDNIGGFDITDAIVYDLMKVENGGELGSIELFYAGATRYFTFDYTVTWNDAMGGTVENTAYVTGTASNGDSLYDDDTDFAPTGFNYPMVTLKKDIVSTPKNGSYYVLGEQVDCVITVRNVGNLALEWISVLDGVDYSTGFITLASGFIPIAPSASVSYPFSFTVQQEHVDGGWAGNYAEISGTFTDGSYAYASDYVTVAAGRPSDTVTFTPSGGGSGSGDYCRSTLGSFSANGQTSELDYCAEHEALAEKLSKLGAVAGMTEAKTVEASLAAWSEAVDKEYAELAARGSAGFADLVQRNQKAWAAWLESEKAELTQRLGDEAKTAAILTENARRHCAWLCYLNGAPTSQRPDSYLSGAAAAAAGQNPALCTREVSANGGLVTTVESLCAAHAALEDELVKGLSGTEPVALFTTAKQRWLMAMSAQNQAYLTADGDQSVAVSRERAAFGKLLGLEEELLTAIYVDSPETVQELLMQTVRAHVLDRCV